MPKPDRRRGRPTVREQVQRVGRYVAQVSRARNTSRWPRENRRSEPPTANELRAVSSRRNQLDARRRALYLKASGRTLHEIAGDPLVVRHLGGRKVSAARISQLLSAPPWRASEVDVDEDVARIEREYTRHLDTANDADDRDFWVKTVSPRLWARLWMAQPEWVERTKRLADDEHGPPSGRRGEWRLDLRDRIISHLFFKKGSKSGSPPISESGERVKELAKKFSISPRTVCRIVSRRS